MKKSFRRSFIASLKAGNTIKDACQQSGISKPTYYVWRKRYPIFKITVDRIINNKPKKLVEKIVKKEGTKPKDIYTSLVQWLYLADQTFPTARLWRAALLKEVRYLLELEKRPQEVDLPF